MSAKLDVSAEVERIRALKRYDILDTPADGAFDRIARVAAKVFDAPIALVTLVDEDRIWFKARYGLSEVRQIGRDPGLCASGILQDDVWTVENAATDIRTLANPLVAGEFGLRFYAGAPLHTWDGHNLGMLCVIDRQAREASAQQQQILQELAGVVVDEMELRLSSLRAIVELEDAVRSKDLMAKEVEHRVMNSLQLISSVVRLQMRGAPEAAKVELKRVADRISAVGRAHQHLTQTHPEAARSASDAAYFRVICDDLKKVMPEGSSVDLEWEAVDIPESQLASLGLIVSELVTNSIKAGSRRIVVKNGLKGGILQSVAVYDDGTGFPDEFDPTFQGGGLGMKVISSLAERLHATPCFNVASPLGGACVVLAFEALVSETTR